MKNKIYTDFSIRNILSPQTDRELKLDTYTNIEHYTNISKENSKAHQEEFYQNGKQNLQYLKNNPHEALKSHNNYKFECHNLQSLVPFPKFFSGNILMRAYFDSTQLKNFVVITLFDQFIYENNFFFRSSIGSNIL